MLFGLYAHFLCCFFFFCFADTSWERALIIGVWFGGFQCRTNQAGLGLGVDGHGALESGQCIAGR